MISKIKIKLSLISVLLVLVSCKITNNPLQDNPLIVVNRSIEKYYEYYKQSRDGVTKVFAVRLNNLPNASNRNLSFTLCALMHSSDIYWLRPYHYGYKFKDFLVIIVDRPFLHFPEVQLETLLNCQDLEEFVPSWKFCRANDRFPSSGSYDSDRRYWVYDDSIIPM